MTVSIHNVGRVRASGEPNGSFCTEIAIGSFLDIQVVEGTTKLVMNRPFETPKMLQQHIDGYPSKVPMPRRGSFSFSTPMRGQDARVTGTNNSNSGLLFGKALFQISMGAELYSNGTTIASTSTTTVLNVTSATNLSEGGSIACATGTGGALECREIKTISSNVVTVKMAFSSIPANASQVYGCSTYSLAALDGSTVLSMQMLVEGYDSTDRWLLKGGQISAPPVFKLAPGTIPTVDWAWQFADHKHADGSETTMSPTTALADANYADTSINAVMDSELRIVSNATSSLSNTLIEASEITITPNFAYEPHITPSGVNNIKQWVRTRVDGPAVTGEFVVPYEGLTWRTARDAETSYGLYYQVGSSVAGGGFMISVPNIVIDDVQRESVGGIAGQRVKFYARLDASTTTNSTALQKSCFRVHNF